MKTKALLAVALLTVGCWMAQARSLLYYYDFDTSSSGSVVWSGQNRGTGTVTPTFKSVSGQTLGAVTPGALGSDGAFNQSNNNALWIGDGSNSLGCNTTSGFTLSMWVKFPASYNAWSNFFGFRLGGVDYRFEYGSAGSKTVLMYRSKATQVANAFTYADENWHHIAFVCLNGTNEVGRCKLYLDGTVRDVAISAAGALQQIYLGPWVRSDGSDRKTGGSNTKIDEFALYDYPATEAQIKWLGKFRPDPTTPSPARAMPYCYQFHRAGDGLGGAVADNSGTGSYAAYKTPNQYANWSVPGALNSHYLFNQVNNKTTFRVDGTEEDSLGATTASGFTFTFWLRAPSAMVAWGDFMCFRIGNRYARLEATNGNTFTFFGANSSPDISIPAYATWYHYALAWNADNKRIDVYRNGTYQVSSSLDLAPSDSTALLSWLIGPYVLDNNGKVRDSSRTKVNIDELSLFNYTLSTDQIAWLAGGQVPNLPPMAETNLTRTVAANASWSGNSGVWTDANDSRRVRYPTLEDVSVKAAATFTANATLTVDTVVTPKEISFLAGKDVTPTVTMSLTENARFEPTTWNLGANVAVKAPLYALHTKGTLAFSTGSKIVFDVANYTGANQVMTCDGMTFPAGTTDENAFFETTDPTRYAAVVAADHKSVSVKLIVAATAEWTRGAGTDDVTNPANWTCYDGDGEVLANALPCDVTTIVVRNGATCNFVPGQTPTYFALKMDAGAKLGGDCDWRGLGVVKFASGTTIDLGGHSLTTVGGKSPFETATITDSVGGGALHVEVGSGLTITNDTVAFSGKMELVKDGAGTLCVAYPAQSYVGGTRVVQGLLKYGTANRPLGAINVTNTVANGATLDMNGFNDTSASIYSWKLAGTLVQNIATSGMGYNAAGRCFGRDLILTGDATIRGGNFYFGSPSYKPAYLTSNGHTLTVVASNYIGIGEWRDTDAGGTIEWDYSGNGGYEALNGYGCTRTKSVFKGQLKVYGGWDVGSFAYDFARWASNYPSPYLLVFGRYEAGPMRPPLRLQNGATLDLTQQTAAFNADGLRPAATNVGITYSQPGAVDFASGATVTIDVSGRTLTKGEQVVAWSAKPEGVTFVWDADTATNEMPIYVGTYGIYYGADEESTVVDRAEWVGGEDSDVANPANWSCYNLAGRAVANGMPGEFATVYLTGAINLQIPRGKTLTYANIVCNNVSLAADCDWSGLTTAQSIASTIDVAGHRLTLPQLTGTGTITSSVAGGVLEVNVAEGLTLTNTTVTLTGSTKLALLKTGAGTLVMQKANTGLGLTTVTVREGYMKKWPETDSIGTDGTKVVVEDGAQFDLNGRAGDAYYNFTLVGEGPDGTGALVNNLPVSSAWSCPSSRGFFYWITLGADATIGGSTSWIMASWNNQRHGIRMNGHTATFVDSRTALYTAQMHYIGPGSIKVDSSCVFEVYPYTITASNCTLEVSGRLQNRNYAMTDLDNLIFTSTGAYYAYEVATQTYTVMNKYAPNTRVVSESKMTSPKVQLGDATHLNTTLDLNNFTEPFGATNTTFYAGSTVAVDISKRQGLKRKERIATWNSKPAGVNFKASDTSRRLGFLVLADDEGLVADRTGIVILVR